jgi:hypothetical protein
MLIKSMDLVAIWMTKQSGHHEERRDVPAFAEAATHKRALRHAGAAIS